MALTLGAIGTTIGMFRAMDAEERVAIEAANTQFRLRLARNEATRAVDDLGRTVWQARRAHDYAYFMPEHVRAHYPEVIFAGFDAWLGQLFPELGPTTWNAEDPGEELPEAVQIAIQSFAADPFDPRREPLYEWVRRNESRLLELIAQIHAGDPLIMLTWQDGRPLWEGLLPSLGARKYAVSLLGAYAVACYLDDDEDHMMAALQAARSLARATGSTGNFLAGLADVRARRDFYSITRWIMLDSLRRGRCPDRCIQLIVDDPPLQPMDAGIRYEALAARQLAGELFVVRERAGRPRFDESLWNDVRKTFYDPPDSIDADLLDLDRTLEAIDDATRAYLRIVAEPEIEMRLHQPFNVESLQAPEVASFLMPDLTNALLHWARSRRERDATIITAALVAYCCQHDAWPENLDIALEHFPAQPAHRRYFGQAFIYRVDESGRPALYLVGANQSDDGGSPVGDPPLDEIYLNPRAASGDDESGQTK